MAKLLWLFLGCVLLWSCGPISSVMGLDNDNDDVRAKASAIVVARGVSRKLLQQNAADAAAKLKIEEGKLKSEIEKEILAQVEEKFKQAMHLEKDTQAVQQKTDAVVEDAEKRRKEEEAQRKRMEEEAERKRKEEEERKKKEEEEKRKKEEEERKRKEEEERKRKEEEEKRKKEEEERKHKEEEERKRKEEEERKKKEEEAKKQKEEEERKKREEEERKQMEEEANNFQHVLDTKIIPELKQRCSTFPKWTALQVERCLSFAEDGVEYDPLVFDVDDDDFSSMVVKPTLNSIGRQHEPTSALKSLLKVAFLIALVVAYLRHVNCFRKNRLWNAMILKSRTLLFHVSKHKQQNRHRHAG